MKKVVTKPDLIKAISETTKITQKDVRATLDALMEEIKQTLSKGDNVSLIGFGSFQIANRAARKARDFKTKEIINVPAYKTVHFKIGNGLKKAVR